MQITYRYIEVNVFTIVSTVRIKPHTLIKSVQILSLACRLSRSLEFMFLVHLDQTNALTWRPSSVVSSVVCKLFTFQASSPKPLGQLEPT